MMLFRQAAARCLPPFQMFLLAEEQGLWYYGIMNTEIRKRRGFAALYKLCPAAHIIALISALIIALHLLLHGGLCGAL